MAARGWHELKAAVFQVCVMLFPQSLPIWLRHYCFVVAEPSSVNFFIQQILKYLSLKVNKCTIKTCFIDMFMWLQMNQVWNSWHTWFCFLLVFFFFVSFMFFETRFRCVAWLYWNLFYRPGWPWSQRDLSASVSQILRLKECITTRGFVL